MKRWTRLFIAAEHWILYALGSLILCASLLFGTGAFIQSWQNGQTQESFYTTHIEQQQKLSELQAKLAALGKKPVFEQLSWASTALKDTPPLWREGALGTLRPSIASSLNSAVSRYEQANMADKQSAKQFVFLFKQVEQAKALYPFDQTVLNTRQRLLQSYYQQLKNHQTAYENSLSETNFLQPNNLKILAEQHEIWHQWVSVLKGQTPTLSPPAEEAISNYRDQVNLALDARNLEKLAKLWQFAQTIGEKKLLQAWANVSPELVKASTQWLQTVQNQNPVTQWPQLVTELIMMPFIAEMQQAMNNANASADVQALTVNWKNGTERLQLTAAFPAYKDLIEQAIETADEKIQINRESNWHQAERNWLVFKKCA
ncbi:MAG: hypothetical protein HC848_01730 [Limnobacter sp.]|nr:hypothetical protein [Limnobacter sp.]